MSQYLLPCSCGQKVRLTVAQAGGEVTCACGQRLAVPTLRGMRQLESAPEAPVASKSTWSPAHGAFFAGGLVLVCLGLALLAYHAFYYTQLGGYRVDRSADVIKEYAAQLDKITPPEALDLWRTEILEQGLGEPEEPWWVTAQKRSGEHLWWLKFGGVAVALGLLMSAGALLIARR